jgi:hypothetical protein
MGCEKRVFRHNQIVHQPRKPAGSLATVRTYQPGHGPAHPRCGPRVAPMELLPSAPLGMVGCASPLLSTTELERPQPPPS